MKSPPPADGTNELHRTKSISEGTYVPSDMSKGDASKSMFANPTVTSTGPPQFNSARPMAIRLTDIAPASSSVAYPPRANLTETTKVEKDKVRLKVTFS